MDRLKKTFKCIFIIFTAITTLTLVVVLSAGLWVYFNPEESWQTVERHLLPEDLQISWSDIHFSVNHVKRMNWDFEISFDNISVTKLDPEVIINLEELTIDLSATIIFPRTEVEIKNFYIKSLSSVSIRQKLDPNVKQKPFDPSDALEQVTSIVQTLQSYQDRVTLNKIDISIDKFEYQSGDSKPILASIKISKPEVQSHKVSFEVELQDLTELAAMVNLVGSVDLKHFGTETSFMNFVINVNSNSLKVKTPISITYKDEQLKVASDIEGAYKMNSKWIRWKPQLQILADKRMLDVKLQIDINGLPGPISKLNNINVHYILPIEKGEWLNSKGSATVKAPVPLFFMDESLKKQIEASCSCKLASFLQVKMTADVWLNRLLSSQGDGLPAIDAELRVQEVKNAIFNLNLGASLQVMRTHEKWLLNPIIDSKVHISRFKEVREILLAGQIMVPAPLNVLDGAIDLIIKSPVSVEDKSGDISIEAILSTDLQSKKQKVKVSSILKARATADFKKINIDVDASIDDLQVELPPLDPVRGMPRIARDSRIHLAPVVIQKKPSTKINLSFKIKTLSPGAIRLLYPLADPFIPITINYGWEGDIDKGYIKIEPFKITYLKRTVFVDSMRLNLDETADADFPIDGKFHVQQTNHKVMIRVTGTTQKPNIDLSSEPYLDRPDIVSVLLFDRTRDNLVGGDAETSGNAQAAMADKAVGLFGLWAFASTPIRSVSYNSVTKVYSATIVLGKGLTAGIGTSLDQYASLEIRKRLSKRWVIATSWAPNESSEQAGEVVLQWEKRY